MPERDRKVLKLGDGSVALVWVGDDGALHISAPGLWAVTEVRPADPDKARRFTEISVTPQ